ncbi:MAG: hypothetical protein ACLU9S_09690 [Oscillospiraceae bacterium]
MTAEYSMLPQSQPGADVRDAPPAEAGPRSAESPAPGGPTPSGRQWIRRLCGDPGPSPSTATCPPGDGGTRTASVTGGFVALVLACRGLMTRGLLEKLPIRNYVAGISAGIVGGEAMLDLCYVEDSRAAVDLNRVMNGNGNLIEVQGTGKGGPLPWKRSRSSFGSAAKAAGS